MNDKTGEASGTGTLYGIGVGPGDPGLLTLKALRVLQTSDLIIAPRSASEKDSTALNTVKEAFNNYGPGETALPEIHYVTFPMGCEAASGAKASRDINSKVLFELQKGLHIAFVTLGDPLLYSTYRLIREKAARLTGVALAHIPGVYSFSAITARLGRELTYGKQKLAVIPVEKNGDYAEPLKHYDTVVFLKVSTDLAGLLAQIKKSGRLKETVLVEKVGLEDEKIYENLDGLSQIFPGDPDKPVHYLSTVIVFND